jgi:hypothetical protein
VAGSANASDTITFSVTGTIILSSALLNLNSNMTIAGPGSSLLTIQRSTAAGTPSFAIFTPSAATVTISGVTITNGRNGIQNGGNLTLLRSVVTGNLGTGGGISNGGTLTIDSSSITNNTSTTNGGGIFNTNALTIINSSISGNVAATSGSSGGNGGGIFHLGTSLNIINSTISGNRSGDGIGGGANGGFGGGLYNINTATLTNVTVSGNSTGGPNDRPGGGGGISNPGTLTLINCTIANNQTGTGAPGAINGYGTGGGVATGGTVTLKNTIAANNTVAGGADGPDLFGTFVSNDYNLIGSTAGATFTGTTTHNVLNQNPNLGPLANNGGLTLTHALLAGSPAIDAADNCVTQTAHCGDPKIPQLITDQRGVSRLVDGPDADTTATVDIGAYETQGPLSSLSDATINEDTQLLVGFDPGDTSTIASVTATSSNSIVVPNDSAHLSAAIVGTTGIVIINPAASLSGTTNITVTVNRTGGGADSATFALTVNFVNDTPSFTRGNDQTVNEDAGPQTVNNWATDISAGPANESGQALTFQVTNNTNPGLFSVTPAISSTGTLTYTPAPDANGSATVTINLKDDGGTANGAVDTSASQTFTIVVLFVNDAPSFTKGPDVTINNNAGNRNIPNWATNLSAGPNETGQTLNFQVTGNTNPSLFSGGPVVLSTGTLSLTPAANAGGTATITVNLKDSGGTANGGVDTSASQSFTITVVPVGGTIGFASNNISTTESSGSVTVTINRSGDSSRAVAVDYATSGDNGLPCSNASGVATPKCDFTNALGTLSFAVGETSKPITVLISQDSFVEGPETMTVTLSNQTNNAALASPATATITIADDGTEPSTNPIDDARNFVRQQYHDFLNREPDASGWDFWTNEITSCGPDDACKDVKRNNVSAAFFLSIEFQQTGYLVERFYKTAYGDVTGTSTLGGSHTLLVPVVRASEFLTDMQRLGRGVVVLQPGWEQVLENNKQAYALDFVQTSRFLNISNFPATMPPSVFVDRMNQRAGMVLSASERQTAIDLFGGASNTFDNTARARCLRMVADDPDLYSAEFNRAFVLVQYFGYLRRNPNDAPDTNHTGFDFWLGKLNQFNGDYIAAEMVKAFISSSEYRQRFGP